MGNVHRTRTTAVSETRPSYYNCVEIVYRLETEELQPISMLPAIPVAKKNSKSVFACSSRSVADT